MEEQKYLFTFEKLSDVRFISHLDMARLFTRAFRRARLPLAYSEGFHAHPKLQFSPPLPVGTESRCECCLALFAGENLPDAPSAREALQKELAGGFAIVDARILLPNEKMPRFTHILYTLEFRGVDAPALEAVLAGALPVVKRTKSGEKSLDLAPLLQHLSVSAKPDGVCVSVALPAKEELTVNPALLAQALKEAGLPTLTLFRAVREQCITI